MKNIGIELRSLSNMAMRAMVQRMRGHSCDLVTGTNGWIIGYILESAGREVYQRELEEKFSVTRSTASKVVNLMEKKGLVERRIAEHDARMLKIALTEKAEALAHEMQRESEELSERLTRGFRSEEIDALCDYIERMKTNLREGD